MPRNVAVEEAVGLALDAIDRQLGGATINLPPPGLRRAADDQIERQRASVRVASLFLTAYAVKVPRWDCDSVPVGIRGKYGDKALADSLSVRHLTLHDNITAFGENLGWKGNVGNVALSRDDRFATFAGALKKASVKERRDALMYLASKFADSRQTVAPLPPLGPDILTFARAKALFYRLIAIQSEGHIQQFLIAALLEVHRRPHGVQIKTHHPHASDKFDGTAGDIEEFVNGVLRAAYEVTVRTDWKNRLQVFRQKMQAAGLSKYVIIARNVNDDQELAVPARLIAFLEPAQADLAVVDIEDFVNVFAAELSAVALREAVNLTYEFLLDRRLSGREDFQAAFRSVVDEWLDTT